jgi:hypothetical protein
LISVVISPRLIPLAAVLLTSAHADEQPLNSAHPAKLSVSPEDILASRDVSAGNRTVTVQSLKPLVLPPAATLQSTPASTAVMEEPSASEQTTRLLVVGATVYHLPNHERSVRVLLRIWDQEAKQNITCWSSANWRWLSGAPASFAGKDGRKYALMLSLGEGGDDLPAIPEFKPGQAFVITDGSPSPEIFAAVQAAHDLLHEQGERLKSEHERREVVRKEREAQAAAAQAQPKKLIIRQWRIDAAGQAGFTSKTAATE